MIFPSTKTIKDEIRDAIGITATFIFEGVQTECSICSASGYLDSINKKSLWAFCPICSGEYYFLSSVSSGIVAHVRWGFGDESDHGIGGDILAGQCTITIASDAISPSSISKIKEIQVDGKRVEPFRHTYRGVPTRDRIRFQTKEFGVV